MRKLGEMMAITAMASAGADQYVNFVKGDGELTCEAVLVWAAFEKSNTPQPMIWCCGGVTMGISHVRREHGAVRIWVGDRPQ